MTTANVSLIIGGTITFGPSEPVHRPKVMLGLMLDGGFVVTGEADNMDAKIPEGKRIKIKLTPMDVSGNPAPIDGNAAWASENDALLQVVPDAASPSQLQAWIQNAAGGSLGATNIKCVVDADQGAGVKTVEQLLAFEAIAGEAAAFGVEQVGELEDIPA